MLYWLAFQAQERATLSLPHSEYEHQWSVNNFWSYKSGNSEAIWSLLCIIKVLAAYIGKRDRATFSAPSWKWASTEHERFLAFHHCSSKRDASVIVYIPCSDSLPMLNGHELFIASLEIKLVVTVQEAVAGTSLAYLPREAANSTLIEVCNHAPLRLRKMRDLKSLTLSSRWFARWGRVRVASSSAYKRGQYLHYDYQQSMPALIRQDARPKIIDTLLTLISRMGQGAFVYIVWSQRRQVHPKKTTMYHRSYCTITSRISEGDDQLNNVECKTGDLTRRV